MTQDAPTRHGPVVSAPPVVWGPRYGRRVLQSGDGMSSHTVREGARTELHELADAYPDRIEVETVDISQLEQVATLRDRLVGRSFDMLFINAGTANMKDEIAGEIATDEYARVLVTNALGPMRVIEACRTLVGADGLIGVMSSGQGSITNNTNGRHEVYRSSKAALNQLVSSYAARMPTIRARWC